ncbi:MAG: hypothetical protein Q6L58_06100 [Thermostichales cyanobacterium BF3_bins_165]
MLGAWRLWLGWGSTLVFLGLACRQVDLTTVWQRMLGAHPWGLGLAALALPGAYGLRARRWQACFRDPHTLDPQLLAPQLLA